MLFVLLPFLCLVVADHAIFTLPGGPQVILGVFQPRAPLACGFVVTNTAVFYFNDRYNFSSRFDVQNYVSDPDRVPASAAMFFGPPDNIKTAFLVIGDNMGKLNFFADGFSSDEFSQVVSLSRRCLLVMWSFSCRVRCISKSGQLPFLPFLLNAALRTACSCRPTPRSPSDGPR
jgi:hypothetical protein